MVRAPSAGGAMPQRKAGVTAKVATGVATRRSTAVWVSDTPAATVHRRWLGPRSAATSRMAPYAGTRSTRSMRGRDVPTSRERYSGDEAVRPGDTTRAADGRRPGRERESAARVILERP